MASPKNNYMKYWKAVRYYAKMKYGITQVDLDLLFFAYDEKYILDKNVKAYKRMITLDSRILRRMCDKGFLMLFKKGKSYKSGNIYEMTYKGRRVIAEIYNLLEGSITDAHIPKAIASGEKFVDRKYIQFVEQLQEDMKHRDDQSTTTTSLS